MRVVQAHVERSFHRGFGAPTPRARNDPRPEQVHAGEAMHSHLIRFIPLFALGLAACGQANGNPPVTQQQAGNAPVAANTGTAPPIATLPPLPPSPVPATFDVAGLAEQVKPVVVNITTTSTGPDMEGVDPFEFFFGPHGQGQGGP